MDALYPPKMRGDILENWNWDVQSFNDKLNGIPTKTMEKVTNI